MLSQIFGKRATTKTDVVIGIVAALAATAKAVSTVKQYKTENDPTINEEQK